jgi:ribosome-binding protein aMBF1 (putative translation factor)
MFKQSCFMCGKTLQDTEVRLQETTSKLYFCSACGPKYVQAISGKKDA